MVRLARDSAESPGRRRTPPAGHVGGDLAGKGETDDWMLVPETFFSVRRCANARCRTEGLDALITFVRGSVPWNWSCSPRMLVRASSRPPRWIPEARTRCVQSPMRPTTFHLGDYSTIFHVKSTWRSQFNHFTSIIFPYVWANSIVYCGHVSLFMHLRFWA